MSRTGKQALIAVLVLSALSFLVVGSFLGRTAEASNKLDRSVKRVELASGNGDVEIVGSDTNQIEVRERVRHRFGKPDHTYEVKGDTVRLESDCGWGWGCNVDYVVTVPKGTEITGQSSSGDVTVHDLAAPVNVKLSSGDLEVSNLEGSLRAELSSGSVSLEQIRGDVDARTTSGDITLNEVTGKTKLEANSGEISGDVRSSGAVEARTTSGDIELQVADAKSIQAQATSGSIHLDVPDRAYKVDADASSGDVNLGDLRQDDGSEYAINVKATSGDIDLSTN
ncbi:DUF4097 family beta strand repeat-containing protein [Flindersiella endophytica]